MAEAKVLSGAGLRGQIAGQTELCTVGKEGAENVRIAQERLTHWISKGAQMSDTVTRLAKGLSKSAAPAA